MIGPYKEFRVMRNYFPREDRRKMEELDCPRSIPWVVIEGHRKQAEKNHCDQTLERLQERGGLSPAELALALQDRPLFPDIDKICTEEAVGVIKAFVMAYEHRGLMPPFHEGCRCVFNPETGDFETPGGDEYACSLCMSFRGLLKFRRGQREGNGSEQGG